jgi:type VII secretion protein EccB
MVSRSDDVRAQRLAGQRLTAALVAGRPDVSAGAGRRGAAAAVVGVVVAAASLAVVAVIAVVSPSDGEWRRSDAVIVERETGARFVVVDGVLHPVANYASARLIVGAPSAPVVNASRAQLGQVGHGRPLGITGAPDSLPAVRDLVSGAWSVCATAAGDGVVFAGQAVGIELGGRAILALAPDGQDYLIWHGRRLHIGHRSVVLSALGLLGTVPTPISAALVAAMPPGADLDVIRVPGWGGRSAVPGLSVGAVVTPGREAGTTVYAVATRDGLAVISAMQAEILLNDPVTPGSGVARVISKPAFAAASHPALPAGTGWPSRPPRTTAGSGGICVALSPTGTPGAVTVGGVAGAMGPATGGVGSGGGSAVTVVLAPGHGVLVRVAGASSTRPCLLTEVSTCFPIADDAALASLGYAGAPMVTMPAGLVVALQHGPVLSRSAAMAG